MTIADRGLVDAKRNEWAGDWPTLRSNRRPRAAT
jgi:hypothetical protein